MEINETSAAADVLFHFWRGDTVTYNGHEIMDVTLFGNEKICCIYEQNGKQKQVIV